MVNPAGGDRVVFSESRYPTNEVTSCGNGRYVVFRTLRRSGGAEANFWRVDSNGTNLTRLTFGLNERVPACSNDGKWLYYLDAGENHFLKRIPIEGGSPETIVKFPSDPYALSPDGKTAVWCVVKWADTGTGPLMIAVLRGLADVERDLIRTRTAEGRSRAQKRGQHMGRPSKLTDAQKAEARRRRAEGATLAELARSYDVGKSTISRLTI